VATADELKQLFRKSGIALNSHVSQQLLIYLALLEKWNERINLSSSTDWPVIGAFFQEGIWSSSFYPSDAVFHLDIGSGAGFPALIIRILIPHIRLEMVESRAKKTAFLETVVNELNLNGTDVYHARLDEHLRRSTKVWDCITWKGLKLCDRDLVQLCAHSHPQTQFWMFHGKEMSVENPKTLLHRFRLLRRERFPARKGWVLSVFTPR
jgi:16S rRNA (guanine(527)-N(7))-methyltransferase RsmG